MNELIKVTYSNDRPVVSARELHSFLEVQTKYQDWFPRMCEYGFTEGIDFNFLKIENVPSQKRERTYTMTDAALTIDMAKEICMIQRSEKGKQARQYFIQLEKDWNSPEKVMARALDIAHKQLAELKGENVKLLAENAANKPKVIFADAVSASERSILVGELAKLLRQNGVEIGQNRLFDWMRQKGFLIRRQGTDYNMPTQRATELGLFEIKETSVVHSAGNVTINKTPKVTGKGQVYFINRFLAEAARPQPNAAEMRGGVTMFYLLHKRKLLPIDPDRVYAFCPSCGVLHAVDLQSIVEAEGEDFDLLKTIDYCAECSQVRKEDTQHE